MNLPSQATHNKAKINYILYYFVLLIIHLNITNIISIKRYLHKFVLIIIIVLDTVTDFSPINMVNMFLFLVIMNNR